MTQLRPLTYRLLLEEPQTGYSLAKNIEKRTGWKPSWGSIYPQLEELEQQGIIQGEDTGRSTTYHLTAHGRKEAKKKLAIKNDAIDKIIEQMRILHEVSDEDMQMPIAYLQELKQDKQPFGKLHKDVIAMRNQIGRLLQEDKLQDKSTEIKTILRRARKELSEL